MDLIYTDEYLRDIGVLSGFDLDYAYGEDENDFVLTVSAEDHVLSEDCVIYVDRTDIVGIIDGIKSDVVNNTVTYSGRTATGLLNSKVIQPDAGQDYYTVSGDANSILNTLINRLRLGDLFVADTAVSEVNVSTYSFDRYCYGYDGIAKMLRKNGGKLMIRFVNQKIMLSAVPLVDYSQDEEFDSDQVQLTVECKFNPVNHIIALGKGDLAERNVIHYYADQNGNISQTQTFFDMDEVCYVYEYTNSEDLDADAKKKLEELWSDGKVDVELDATQSFDIGDIVQAKDLITGVSVKRAIAKKIVTMNDYEFEIEYKVGD